MAAAVCRVEEGDIGLLRGRPDGAEFVLFIFDEQLLSEIEPAFRDKLDRCYAAVEKQKDQATIAAAAPLELVDGFHAAVTRLHGFVEEYMQIGRAIECNGDDFRHSLLLHMKAQLFHSISWRLLIVIEKVWLAGFSALKIHQRNSAGQDVSMLDVDSNLDDESDDDICAGCQSLRDDECACATISDLFGDIRQKLFDLDVLESVCGDAVVKVAGETIDAKVAQATTGCFDVHHFAVLEQWLSDSMCHWLQLPAAAGHKEDAAEGDLLTRQRTLLRHRLHISFARSIIRQLFDCIVDFPDSAPALKDLKECLRRVSLRSELVHSLQDDVMNRLLHPGVNTTQVLVAYTQAVKSLRLVDPSGVIMDIVCQPIRTYIRHRSDSVRCIVSLLTDRGQLNASGHSLGLFDAHTGDADDSADQSCYINRSQTDLTTDNYEADSDEEGGIFGAKGARWANWKPDPLDADIGEQSEWRRSADMVSMLVGIYGSRELFVNEYRLLLSERLLRQPVQQTETETRYLELLKSRFGDAELHHCEPIQMCSSQLLQVMLKDTKDSHRVNDYIRESAASHQMAIPITARILSSHFWPKLREDRLKLPEVVQRAQQQYRVAYETFKASRTLEWIANLGTVDVELEMAGQALSLTVTPLQAALIIKFQEKESWTTDELSSSLHVSGALIRRRLTTYAQLGLLLQAAGNKDEWCLCASLPVPSTSSSSSSHSHHQQSLLPTDLSQEDDDDEHAQANTESLVDSLEQYWPYVQNMLRTLHALKADRLHTLLRMFNSPGQDGPTLETVTAFLQRKVTAQLLTHQNGLYKLPKK